MPTRTVLVPSSRVERWFDNFADRHGAAPGVLELSVDAGVLQAAEVSVMSRVTTRSWPTCTP